MNQEKYAKFFIGISLLIFVLMCYMYVKYPFMKVDEGYTMGMINLPVGDMISVTASDVHSPLYYLIVMFFTSLNIFNADMVYVMKFTSIIPYLIIVILSLTKIKKDYGILTSGIFLFALTSMSTFFMFYLTARSYSWSLLVLLLSFIVLKDLLDNPNIKSWILLSITSVLCAYFHYFAAISAFTIYLMLFIYLIFKNKSQIRNFFISVILSVVLYLPWMFTLFSQMSAVKKSYWIEPVSLGSLLTCSSYYLTAYTNKIVLIVSALILLCVLVYALKNYLKNRQNAELYPLIGVLTFIGTIIVGAVISITFKPILHHTYVLPASGVLWLSIAILVPKMNNKKLMLAVLILILLIGGVNIYKECDLITDEYENTLYEQNVLDSINNNDSVVIFKTDNRFVRTYWALDNVYEKFASYSLGNKTYTLHNPNFDANYTTIDLPEDLSTFNGKNVYLIAFNQTKIKGIDKELVGVVQNSNVYKIK